MGSVSIVLEPTLPASIDLRVSPNNDKFSVGKAEKVKSRNNVSEDDILIFIHRNEIECRRAKPTNLAFRFPLLSHILHYFIQLRKWFAEGGGNEHDSDFFSSLF